MDTLEEILKSASSILDLSYELPTGDELTTRTNFANQAIKDACDFGKLPDFKKEYLVYATTATISLPANFRELHENPQVWDTAWIEYPEIEAEEKYNYDTADKYCYVLGNGQEGKYLYLNNFTEGTVSIIYQKYPQGFATLTDKCELSSPSYVVQRIVYYVLYSRGDDKFPLAKAESEKILANMLGRQSSTSGGQGRVVPVKFKNPLR